MKDFIETNHRNPSKFILSALEDGEYAIAVDHYLQLLDSLTAHFIADEHWCWFVSIR